MSVYFNDFVGRDHILQIINKTLLIPSGENKSRTLYYQDSITRRSIYRREYALNHEVSDRHCHGKFVYANLSADLLLIRMPPEIKVAHQTSAAFAELMCKPGFHLKKKDVLE